MGVGVGEGVTVLVVCGCVPPGEALGNGVTIAVGCGETASGVTVAVGRGPAGMLGLGSGLTDGDCASSDADVAKSKIVRNRGSVFIACGSSGEPRVDVGSARCAMCVQMHVAAFRGGEGDGSLVRPADATQKIAHHLPALRSPGRDRETGF